MKSEFRSLPALVVLVGLGLLFVLPTQTRRQVRRIAANSQVAADADFTTNLEFAPLIVLAPDDNQTPTAGPFACVDPDGNPRSTDAQRKPLPWANWQGTVHHYLPRESFSLGGGKGRYLAFLGRTSPEKGLDRAIEIAKRAEMPLKIAAKIDRVDVKYFETVIKPLLDHPLAARR